MVRPWALSGKPFKDEWRDLLPPELAEAELPVFEPVDQVPSGVVY